MSRAQTIQVFLPSGDPTGIRVAGLTTRTVRVFDVPRTLLGEFIRMPAASQVAVYYLFGGEDDERKAYIGQTGSVGDRLSTHATEKSFWERAMVAVSLTDEWTTTHAAYLEWLSIRAARRTGRYTLTNGNAASNPHTPLPLEADCLEFMDTISVLLSTLGTPIFDAVASQDGTPKRLEGASGEPLYFKDSGCEAIGHLVPEGIVVERGSRGRSVLRPSAPPRIAAVRAGLRDAGRAVIQDDALVFLQDVIFDSPSAAGAALVGGSVNGRTSWKNEAGEDLAALEARDLQLAQRRPPASSDEPGSA